MIERFFASLINWVAGLFSLTRPKRVDVPTGPDEGNGGPYDPTYQPKLIEASWFRKAKSYMGVREIPGAQHNAQVLAFFAKAGFPGIDNDEVAWCAGFVNACLEESGISGSKSLAARSFLTWGKEVSKPQPGDIVVFWRNSPTSWQGHVGFYVDETSTHIRVLGGNQSNEVNVSSYSKAQLLGYRTPVKPGNSRTYRAGTLGLVTAGIGGVTVLDSVTQLTGISSIVKEMGTSMPTFQLAAWLINIAILCVIIWARYDDNKTKGR